MDLAIIVPVLGREALLQSLYHSLQTQLAFPASLKELEKVSIAAVCKDVAYDSLHIVRLAVQSRASARLDTGCRRATPIGATTAGTSRRRTALASARKALTARLHATLRLDERLYDLFRVDLS